jgi:hypothetical protein
MHPPRVLTVTRFLRSLCAVAACGVRLIDSQQLLRRTFVEIGIGNSTQKTRCTGVLQQLLYADARSLWQGVQLGHSGCEYEPDREG